MYNGQLGVATDDNGLYYMRSRYYNPDIKRFINQDVLIGSITSSNSLNRYSYVEGNPVSYTDPFGLSPFSFLNVFNPSVLIHTTLDILGCLPGGSIFDLANAALYWLEGNEDEFWSSLFFAIPGMDLAGKGMKWGAKIGGKGGKILENTLKAVDMAGHLKAIQLSATDFGNDIAFMIDKYMVGEAEWSSETAWELVSLAGHGFQLKSFSGSFMNNVNAGTYDSLIPGMSTANINMYEVVDWLAQYDFVGNRGGTNFHGDSDFGNKGGTTSGKYQVGAYQDIKGIEGLDAHHVGQKAIMKKFVTGYDELTAPAINVPKLGHTIRHPERGIVSRSTKGITNARQLLARDLFELKRVYPDIPKSSLRKLIDMNMEMYPEMRKY